ncbi:hypothetical protein K0M31_017499 [Melipona bicolor]|uniref:Uncharacterized protein n=1 Tax=Melipona bicolor TaxID=60889 RepID=A0AA40G572_9HYME|nr:hypothetical protein K0M31_017499 [Melipona bicolor]
MAQLVVAACFLETGENRSGKGEEGWAENREKVRKQRRSRLHTNESGLSSPQFPLAIVARKRTP